MPRHKYLRKQGNVWYVELVIPTDVLGLVLHNERSPTQRYGKPRKKFSKSMRTSNLREALVKSYFYLAQWQSEIASIRNVATDQHNIRAHLPKDRPFDTYVDEWLEYHKYNRGSEIVARRLIRSEIKPWVSKFSDLSEANIKSWIKDLQNGKSPSGRKLSRASVAHRISKVKAYTEYCVERGFVDQLYIPTTELLPKNSKTKAYRRKILASSYHPFTKKELRLLLSTAYLKRDKRLYYLIVIGMFTGCRISEICDLKITSVRSKSFTVVDSKTYSGIREVPIHPQLQPLVAFLKRVSNDDYLISGLSQRNQQMQRSKGMINKFSRIKTELGFGAEYGFHSFRSTLAHEMENAGVNEIHAARILGHLVKSITYGLYSGKTEFEVLYTALGLVDFDIMIHEFEAESRIMLETDP